MTAGHGLAPGSPFKCTPRTPAVYLTTPLSTLLRDGGQAVLDVAGHQQGEPGGQESGDVEKECGC
jgi:hypothetical protein